MAAGAVAEPGADLGEIIGVGGGESVADQVETTDAAEVETAAEGAEAEGGESTDAEPKQPEDIYKSPDGKAIPAKLAPVFKQYPELRAMFFENREARAAGGVKALVAAHRELQGYGGKAGIEAIRNEVAAWNKFDERFSQGDTSLVDDLASEPEAFGKIVPKALEKLAAVSPEVYAHTVARAMLAGLQKHNVYPALNALYQAAQADTNLAQLVDPLVRFWDENFQLAQQMPARKVDPERQKLDSDRQEFEQRQVRAFLGGIASDARANITSTAERELGKHVRNLAALKSSDPDRYQGMMEFIDSRFSWGITGNSQRSIAADETFNRNKQALIAAGDDSGLRQLYRSRIAAQVPALAQKAARLFAVGAPAAKSAPAKPAAAAATAGVIQGTKPPTAAGLKIDWNRVPPGFSRVQDAIFAGQAFVHGRKELYKWAV